MGRKTRILVVDDERMVRESLTAYLEDEGFAVSGASSAEEALSSIRDCIPDMAIADLRLPGMSGTELILHCAAQWPSLRFLIHTGAANYKLTPDLAAVGMIGDDVFYKPVLYLETVVVRILRMVGNVQSIT